MGDAQLAGMDGGLLLLVDVPHPGTARSRSASNPRSGKCLDISSERSADSTISGNRLQKVLEAHSPDLHQFVVAVSTPSHRNLFSPKRPDRDTNQKAGSRDINMLATRDRAHARGVARSDTIRV